MTRTHAMLFAASALSIILLHAQAMAGTRAAQAEPARTSGPDMSIEISREARKAALDSIERYFDENMDEKIGRLGADALLDYFIAELGPVIYNKAVADAQERLQLRVMELDAEIYESEFQYWRDLERRKKGK